MPANSQNPYDAMPVDEQDITDAHSVADLIPLPADDSLLNVLGLLRSRARAGHH